MSAGQQSIEEKFKALGDVVDSMCRTHATGTVAWNESTADELCESPIEKLFFVAWLTSLFRFELSRDSFSLNCATKVIFPKDGNRTYARDLNPWASDHLPDHVDLIQCQAQIGQYRADFVLERLVRPYFQDKTKVFRTPPVVVECDGHDFHERTKEQAQRDKERDRFLQGEGFSVLRFTGSEIWRDPLSCGDQVELFMQQRICDAMGLGRPTEVEKYF